MGILLEHAVHCIGKGSTSYEGVHLHLKEPRYSEGRDRPSRRDLE